jgi:hypothetical protein
MRAEGIPLRGTLSSLGGGKMIYYIFNAFLVLAVAYCLVWYFDSKAKQEKRNERLSKMEIKK